jgi:hypothetical protein
MKPDVKRGDRDFVLSRPGSDTRYCERTEHVETNDSQMFSIAIRVWRLPLYKHYVPMSLPAVLHAYAQMRSPLSLSLARSHYALCSYLTLNAKSCAFTFTFCMFTFDDAEYHAVGNRNILSIIPNIDDAEYHAVGNRNILIIIPNIWESLGSTLSLSLSRALSPSLSIYSCLLLLSTFESGIEK